MPWPKNGERPYLAVPEATFWGLFLGLFSGIFVASQFYFYFNCLPINTHQPISVLLFYILIQLTKHQV